MSIWTSEDIMGRYLPIRGDGNCLFRALAVGLGGHITHENLRRIIVEEVRDHWDNYVNHVFDYKTPHEYYLGMSKLNVWGASVECLACANIYNRRVAIVSDGILMADFGTHNDKNPIVLRYIGNNHYDLYEPAVLFLFNTGGAPAAVASAAVAPAAVVPAAVVPAAVVPAAVVTAAVVPAAVVTAAVVTAAVAPAAVAPAAVAPAAVAPASVAPASVAPESVAPASVASTKAVSTKVASAKAAATKAFSAKAASTKAISAKAASAKAASAKAASAKAASAKAASVKKASAAVASAAVASAAVASAKSISRKRPPQPRVVTLSQKLGRVDFDKRLKEWKSLPATDLEKPEWRIRNERTTEFYQNAWEFNDRDFQDILVHRLSKKPRWKALYAP